MGIGYFDNAERRATFRDLLNMYDVYGQRAMIMHPIDVKGTIVDQRGHGPGAIFILQLDEKMMFREYLEGAGLVIPGTSLESSQKAKALFDDFNRLGFIESYLKPMTYENSRITHLWAQWQHVVLIDVQRGQPVEYVESQSDHVASIKSTPGIVQNVINSPTTASLEGSVTGPQEVIELFLVHPVSWVRIPRAMDTDYLKPEHVSAWTDRMVVRSTYLNWKEKSPQTLPAGKMSEDGKEYIFESPIKLDDVRGICGSTLTDKERILRCWLGAAMFHVVPIVVGYSGTFRPMRAEVARESIPYIVTRKDIDDALKRGGHFEQNPVYPDEWDNQDFMEGDKVTIVQGKFTGLNGVITGYDDHEDKFSVGLADGIEWLFLSTELKRHNKRNKSIDNPIYPAEWENGSFDPSKFYKLPELKKETIKTFMSYKPKDIQVEPGTYSVGVDTVASGALGTHMPSRIARILGLGDVYDHDKEVDENTKWNDYEFAWEIIDEHTEKIADYINDNIGMPGSFHFGTSEHDGDYVLEYVFSEGDFPEFDARR